MKVVQGHLLAGQLSIFFALILHSNNRSHVDAFAPRCRFESTPSSSARLSPLSSSPLLLALAATKGNKQWDGFEQPRVPLPLPLSLQPSSKSSSSRKQFLSNMLTSTIPLSLAVPLAVSPKQAKATYIDPKTKINLPSVGEIEQAIPSNWDDIDNPFKDTTSKGGSTGSTSSAIFGRLDSADDAIFYNEPRFVEHIDDNAVSTVRNYITNDILLPLKEQQSQSQSSDINVLDLCSSWTSHFTTQTKEALNLNRVAGLGMNEQELKANPVLTEYTVMNLNNLNSNSNSNTLALPYDDSTFDIVLCQLSIDYLIYPLDVMKEVARILKKGGKVVIIFSNRLFLQKAVGLWTGADDIDHAFIVGSYLYFSNESNGNSKGGGAGSGFIPSSIKAKDLSKRSNKKSNGMIVGDPIYVVTAEKGIL